MRLKTKDEIALEAQANAKLKALFDEMNNVIENVRKIHGGFEKTIVLQELENIDYYTRRDEFKAWLEENSLALKDSTNRMCGKVAYLKTI